MVNIQTVGRRVRALRVKAGWTQKQLARYAGGMSSAHLSAFETGRVALSLEALGHVARALDTTVQALYAEESIPARADLPRPLLQLAHDPAWCEELDAGWIKLLSKVQHGGKRPRTKDDYVGVYLMLRRLVAA